MAIALVVFDCDGVLVDSEPIVCRIDADLLTDIGYPITPEELNRRYSGMPDAAMRAAIEADWGRALPADYDALCEARVEACYRAELRAIEGVAEVVQALDLPRCVASSSMPRRLRLALEVTGLLPLFHPHLFSASMVARGKPWPDLFLYAAERMGAAPADCLVVEDSVAGTRAAVAAGMRVIGLTAGGHCPAGHGERLRAEGCLAVAPDARRLGEMIGAALA